MKIKELSRGGYLSPAVELIDMVAQGVLCQSGDKWHKSYNNSDFSYEYEDEITWK